MGNLSRRRFVALAGAVGLASALPSPVSAETLEVKNSGTAASDFTFLFITDTHIQPELNAALGCDQCFKRARTIKADFAIQGGDHVFDSLGVGRERASSLFDLYGKTEQDLGMKVYHTIGNHDCFGVYPASGVSRRIPFTARRSMRTGSARRITPSTTRACISSCSTGSGSPTIVPTRGESTRRTSPGLPQISKRCQPPRRLLFRCIFRW